MCYSIRCNFFYHHFTNINTATTGKPNPRMMASLWIGYHGRELALPPGLPSHLELPVSMASRSRCSATSWKVMAGVRIGLRLLSVTGIITFFLWRVRGAIIAPLSFFEVKLLLCLGVNCFRIAIILLETMDKICLRFLFHMDAIFVAKKFSAVLCSLVMTKLIWLT